MLVVYSVEEQAEIRVSVWTSPDSDATPSSACISCETVTNPTQVKDSNFFHGCEVQEQNISI